MIKKCKQCGKRIEVNNPNYKFCSKNCQKIYWNKHWKDKIKNKKCKTCGKRLLNRNATFCKSHSKCEDKNPIWKGNKVKYDGLHTWIRNHKSKPNLCEKCKKAPPYDLANISGEYKRDIDDFEWLCRRCHMKEDGRREKLIKRIIIQNKGARPRTIPKTEEERQERMRLMEETHKKALFNHYFKDIKEPVIISRKEYNDLINIEEVKKIIDEFIKKKRIGVGIEPRINPTDIKKLKRQFKELKGEKLK